jgi:hypothetical protein
MKSTTWILSVSNARTDSTSDHEKHYIRLQIQYQYIINSVAKQSFDLSSLRDISAKAQHNFLYIHMLLPWSWNKLGLISRPNNWYHADPGKVWGKAAVFLDFEK